ncbi:MAG TPA: sugar phosphate isomerase/epimerase family protein [Verrucomicrobiae bacterium]
MNSHSMSRRHFIQTTTALIAAGPALLTAAEATKWEIGCFNRPWGAWSYDVALDGLKAGGFKSTGLVGDHKGDLGLSATATPEYIAELKKRINDRGLTPNIAWLKSQHNLPVDQSIAGCRKLIDYAAQLGLKYLLSGGVSAASQYDNYYATMADAAKYADDKGVNMVLKPHGGSSGASDEVLKCLEKVNHPNFKVWFDAGNIIYYTGKDPVSELKPIAKYVTGFCAKDCATQKTDVMIQFGAGKVDFKAVFKVLKEAGFNGPVMIECAAPAKTPEEVTANAVANRKFLEKVFAEI